MQRKMYQRDYMRKLIARFGANKDRVVREYAGAERRGEVERKSNSHNWTPEQYASALWQDGIRRGWIQLVN